MTASAFEYSSCRYAFPRYSGFCREISLFPLTEIKPFLIAEKNPVLGCRSD
jgi:hypothetical protein